MQNVPDGKVFDFILIGSGFGGSVCAMRLAQKGYSVLVLEQGKRYSDQDFARSNWQIQKYIWAPFARCFGILHLSSFKDVMVLHGAGVGGGSLGYANVLMEPTDELFDNPAWRHLADWKSVLEPHFEAARRMLGVVENPCFWPADHILRNIAKELGTEKTFQPTRVGVYFGTDGKEGVEHPDPYFEGDGPARRSCTNCGACLIGCRENAKNTLEKNYLYFAEKWGCQILSEFHATNIRPVQDRSAEGARYEVSCHSSTTWLFHPEAKFSAKNVIVAAGSLGTLKLLFDCRDASQTLPNISSRLGTLVRTNNESLLGIVSRDWKTDYSKGIAITSIFDADDSTAIEPVRYPSGSSLMRFLSGPLIKPGTSRIGHILQTILGVIAHPLDFIRTHILPDWAYRTTILLVMQTSDNYLRLRPGRSIFTMFHRGLVSESECSQANPQQTDTGHRVTRRFSEITHGIPAGSLNEALLNIPITAHILGGCPFGSRAEEGVVDLDCQVFNYPGLYVVDGSIMPANPGVNPSLTITALAEYAMSRIPVKSGE